MAYMELSDYLITRLQMFNKDFTPRRKALYKQKYAHYRRPIKSCRRVSIEGGQIVNGENNTSN